MNDKQTQLEQDFDTSWVYAQIRLLMTEEEYQQANNVAQQYNILQHVNNSKKKLDALNQECNVISEKAVNRFIKQFNPNTYAEVIRSDAIKLIDNQIHNGDKSLWIDSFEYASTELSKQFKLSSVVHKKYTDSDIDNIFKTKRTDALIQSMIGIVGFHIIILEKWGLDSKPIYDKIREWITIIDPEAISEFTPTNNHLSVIRSILGFNGNREKLSRLSGTAKLQKIENVGYFQKTTNGGVYEVFVNGYDKLTQRKDDSALKLFNELMIVANQTCIYQGKKYISKDPCEYIDSHEKIPFMFIPYDYFVERGVYQNKRTVTRDIPDIIKIIAGIQIKGDIFGFIAHKRKKTKIDTYAPLFILVEPKDDGIFIALNPILPVYYYAQEFIPFLNAFNLLTSNGYRVADYITYILRIKASELNKNGYIDILMRTIATNALGITADEHDTKHAGERIKKPIIEALKNVEDVQRQHNGIVLIQFEYDETLSPSKFLDSKLRIRTYGIMSKYLEKRANEKEKALKRRNKRKRTSQNY